MKRLSTIFVFIVSTAVSVFALVPNFVTLATNDPTDYQRLVITSAIIAGVSFAGTTLFVYLQKGWFRYAAIFPYAIGTFDILVVLQRWPHVFP